MENNNPIPYTEEDISQKAQDFYRSYNDSINNYVEKIAQDIESVEELEEEFNQKLQGMQASEQNALEIIERNRGDKLIKLEEDRMRQIAELDNYTRILELRGESTSSRSLLIEKLKAAVLHSHKTFQKDAHKNYEENKLNIESAPTQLRKEFQEEYEQSKADILESIQMSRSKVLEETAFFDNYYETAVPSNQLLWNDLKTPSQAPLPFLCIGTSVYGLPDGGQDITLRHFIPFLNSKNIVLQYFAPESNILANGVADAILTRLLMSVTPGDLKINFIDPVRIGRSFTDFLKLPKQVIEKVLTEEQDIQNYLNEVYRYIREATPIYLSEGYVNLAQYNQHQASNQPYQTIVISDFPNGFNEEARNTLSKIMLNGPLVGINIILMIQSVEEDLSEADSLFEDAAINDMLHHFDFTEQQYPFEISYDTLKFIKGVDLPMSEVISYVNENVTLETQTTTTTDDLTL